MRIIRNIAKRDTDSAGFTQEINLIEYEDSNLYIDIRSWNADHTTCTLGMRYSISQLPELQQFVPELREIYLKLVESDAVF